MSTTLQASLTLSLLLLAGTAIYANSGNEEVSEKSSKHKHHKEHYTDAQPVEKLTVPEFSNYVFARPNFRPALPARTDPYRTGSGTIKQFESNFPAGSYVTEFGTQAAPDYPVNATEMAGAAAAGDYSTVGDIAFNTNEYKTECKNMTGLRKQFNSSAKSKSGMDSYTTPEDMLPTPDARSTSCIVEDPRNPQLYMSGNNIGSSGP